MVETYKKIEGFENYSVSDFGNIRNDKTKKKLKCSIDKDGYYNLQLRHDKHASNKKLHRLVAQTFIPNLDNKKLVDHIDNNPANNNLSNLRWATSNENSQNAKKSIRNKSGVKGVSFENGKQKWRACINVDGIYIHIGYYDTIEDATLARIKRANEAFGVFIHKCELVIT